MTAVRTLRVIDEAGVDSVLLAAEKHACANGFRVVITAVDRVGNVLAFRRTPGAQVASSVVAIDRARTAAIYWRPSKDFDDHASSGRLSALHLARAAPLQGGMPLLHNGQVIGAVGVSGASSADEDQELAVLGSQPPSLHNAATYIPRQKVHEQFRTGLLLETPSYKLGAGRRTGPGEVELHDREADISTSSTAVPA